MQNKEVARVLYEIADLLELRDENAFKVRAYRRAAQSIETMSKPVEDFYKEDKLGDIPGVGAGIAEKITEFLETGRSKYLDSMKKKMPMDFEALMSIEGMGPKKVRTLYDRLRIKTVKDLEAAAKAGRIRKLAGFGEKTEQNILKGISFAKTAGQRMLLGTALPIAEEIVNDLKNLPYVKHSNYAGSMRRMKETIGDIDILATSSKPDAVINHFTHMKDVIDIIAQGPTKASVHLKSGLQVDLRVLPEHQYGAALMYFTGSKEHNIEMRKIAIAKGLKLSEYGLNRGSRMIAGRTEEEVYNALGMDYIEPEMREVRGEIELARQHKLPDVIGYNDIRGDCQMHTKWSDGSATVEEMALAAKKLGYEYICITDHVGRLKIAGALDEKRLLQQRKEIDKVSERISGITILQGAEIDIGVDGAFDVPDSVLKGLDIVLASLHSALKQPREKITERVLKAMDNQNIDVFAHPTARLIGRREGADLDMQKIIRKAAETGTVLEIDAQMDRLDMNDANAFAAREAGCKLIVDTDAHSADQLEMMRLGIGVARRAWCGKKDILNTMTYAKFAKEFDISK
jgi:DNA polymerase (family 10)